jgi:hypothetical protein
MKRLKPWIDDQKQRISQETSALTGLHKKHVDSVVAVIDSFISIKWLLQAESVINKFVGYIPKLKSDEQRAEELRPRIVGRWTCIQETKHAEDKTVHAIEKKVFEFSPDGNVTLTEKKEGKSTPYFKEDWMFVSHGNYGIKGDTVVLFIKQFKSAKQNFWDLKETDGKKEWVKATQPTYDSTITDGSQDRYITFQDLQADFVRK